MLGKEIYKLSLKKYYFSVINTQMTDDYLFTILPGQSTLLKPKIILSSFMFREHIYITSCNYNIICNVIKREPAYNTVRILQSKSVTFMLIKSGFWNKLKQKLLLISKQNINKQKNLHCTFQGRQGNTAYFRSLLCFLQVNIKMNLPFLSK